MNIKLQNVSKKDIEQIRIWRNSDLIQNVSYNRKHISAEEQENWYESLKNLQSQLHWIININGTDVGYASIKHLDFKNRRCEFASLYIGNSEFLLNGAGAFAEYEVINYIYSNYPDIDKIYCEVLEFNKKVIQLHKRFGFTVEGELKQHYYINNQPNNVILLALIKSKWSEINPTLRRILKK